MSEGIKIGPHKSKYKAMLESTMCWKSVGTELFTTSHEAFTSNERGQKTFRKAMRVALGECFKQQYT